jgi:hypothetical protein
MRIMNPPEKGRESFSDEHSTCHSRLRDDGSFFPQYVDTTRLVIVRLRTVSRFGIPSKRQDRVFRSVESQRRKASRRRSLLKCEPMRRFSIVVAAIVVALDSPIGRAGGTTPVLVELFTSE